MTTSVETMVRVVVSDLWVDGGPGLWLAVFHMSDQDRNQDRDFRRC
jgi:hypothetical protein